MKEACECGGTKFERNACTRCGLERVVDRFSTVKPNTEKVGKWDTGIPNDAEWRFAQKQLAKSLPMWGSGLKKSLGLSPEAVRYIAQKFCLICGALCPKHSKKALCIGHRKMWAWHQKSAENARGYGRRKQRGYYKGIMGFRGATFTH